MFTYIILPIFSLSCCLLPGTLCPAGYSLADNHINPTHHINNGDCVRCSKGRRSPPGSAYCSDCPAGWKKNPEKTSPSCFACPVGRHAVVADSTSCNNCSIGGYSDEKGTVLCKLCPTGKSSSTQAAVTSEVCTSCGKGRYGDELGQSLCKRCEIGKHNAHKGMSSPFFCFDCDKGKFQDTLGAIECFNCGAGRWNAQTGAISSTACIACALGKYNPQNGSEFSTACVNCVLGKWSSTPAAITIKNCIDCDAGRYSSGEGAFEEKTCVWCSTNHYSTEIGASSKSICKECEFGKINTQNFDECTYTGSNIVICLVAGSGAIVLIGGVYFCRTKVKSLQLNHGMELAETHDNTRRLLDSANNPLEQTQYLIDPSELHLGERVWLLVVVCDCSFVSVLTLLITCLIDRQQNWCGWHGLDF